MTVRDHLAAVDRWLAKRIHGSYIRERNYIRELLNRDESDYPGACDIEGCHRVARERYETDSTSLGLCHPCSGAFHHGLADDAVAVFSAPIEIDATDATSQAEATSP